MSTAAIAMRRNQNFVRTRTKTSLGPVSAGFLIACLVAVLALLYLSQITKTSTFGYQITALQQKRDSLAATSERLQIEAARLQAIQAIAASDNVKQMVPVGQVSYVDVGR